MAIALVNTTSGTSDGSANSLAATAASHTTGNLIVVAVVWSGNLNATIPTDTAGNTYVSTGQKGNNGTSDHVEIFYAKNVTGNAANIVTAHFASNATFRRVMVHQYSGCDTTAPFTTGEGGTALATAAGSVTSSSWVTATASEVLVAGFGSSGGVASGNIVAGTSYAKQLNNIGTDSGTEDRIVSSTGTYTASYTASSGTQTWWIAAASFKAAGGGSTQNITPDTGIAATSNMTAAIQRLRPIPGATANATSAVTASVVRLRPLAGAVINATSTVTATLTRIGNKPLSVATINATSALSSSLRALRSLAVGTINGTSTVTATLTKSGGRAEWMWSAGWHLVVFQDWNGSAWATPTPKLRVGGTWT